MLLTAGCLGGSGGGGGVVESAATIRGVVASFEEGDGADVAVSVAGTDLASTTADDGFFALSGVPPGNRRVVFARDGTQGDLSLDVPERAIIELDNVRVQSGRAEPDSIRVEVEDDTSADSLDDASDDAVDDGDDDSNSPSSGSGSDDDDTSDGDVTEDDSADRMRRRLPATPIGAPAERASMRPRSTCTAARL